MTRLKGKPREKHTWYGAQVLCTINSVADQGEGSAEPVPPPYFQTKLRREGAKKNIFLSPPPPPLSHGLDDHPSNLSEGLHPPLKPSIIKFSVEATFCRQEDGREEEKGRRMSGRRQECNKQGRPGNKSVNASRHFSLPNILCAFKVERAVTEPYPTCVHATGN